MKKALKPLSTVVLSLLFLSQIVVANYVPPASSGGDASAANQTTGNSSLSSIDGKITAVNTGAVTVSSSVLPTGAATAAKQPALGTAGTASADVITVQGKAAMTPLLTDGSATTQPVSIALDSVASATLTQVASSASSVSVLASSATRKGAIFFNASTAICYLAFTATATSTAYTIQMAPNSTYIMDKAIYTGVISGIWASANGNMIVTAL